MCFHSMCCTWPSPEHEPEAGEVDSLVRVVNVTCVMRFTDSMCCEQTPALSWWCDDMEQTRPSAMRMCRSFCWRLRRDHKSWAPPMLYRCMSLMPMSVVESIVATSASRRPLRRTARSALTTSLPPVLCQHSAGIAGGNDEREQTLNQTLRRWMGLRATMASLSLPLRTGRISLTALCCGPVGLTGVSTWTCQTSMAAWLCSRCARYQCTAALCGRSSLRGTTSHCFFSI